MISVMGKKRTRGELDSMIQDFRMMGRIMENNGQALAYMVLDGCVDFYPSGLLSRLWTVRDMLARITEDMEHIEVAGGEGR